MKRLLHLSLLTAAALLAGGCQVVAIQCKLREQELESAPNDVARLKNERQQAVDAVLRTRKELQAARTGEQTAAAALAKQDERLRRVQSEADRLASQGRQIEAGLAAARADDPAPGAASTAPAAVRDLVLRLARLEDWLTWQRNELRNPTNSVQLSYRRDQLRGQAVLFAAALAMQAADLPDCQWTVETDAALQPAAQQAKFATVFCRFAVDRVYTWVDFDSPGVWLGGFGDSFRLAEEYAQGAARKLAELKPPAAATLQEPYLAVSDLARMARPLAEAEESGRTVAAPDRARFLQAILRIRQAAAARQAQPVPESNSVFRGLLLADFALGPRWDAVAYLNGRIHAVAEQRAAMAALLVDDAAPVPPPRPAPEDGRR